MRHDNQLLPSLLVMAWMVEARDPYTGGHLWRVSRYARLLSGYAGLDEHAVARITLGGFLHDLGKIGVPDAILRKPGPLNDVETAIIRTHPEIGMRTLAVHPLANLVREAILFHHEASDGSGYPDGLRGHMIPMDARIVGVCDAFDAMTSSRPYRGAMPIDLALDIIEQNLAIQFDAEMGQQFLLMGRAGALDHIVSHSDDGIPLQQCPMCGPTLVVQRGQVSGSNIYCRNCGGQFIVELDSNGQIHVTPTGRTGTPRDLTPEVDTGLITQLGKELAAAVTGSTLWERWLHPQ